MAILVKTPQQIEGIRRSSRLAADTLAYIAPFVVPGVTTQELNDRAEDFIRRHGAFPAPLNYRGYPKATCISVNEVICHGIPDQTALKDGDIVNIDVTTILHGYYGDTSTMFPVGNIGPEAQHLLDVTNRCLAIGLKQVRPGNYFGNIGYEIAMYANLQLCSVVEDYCGHGTGCFFHEEPRVLHIAPKNSGPKMRPGYVFTIEPMINLGDPNTVLDKDGWTARTKDGKLSAQAEHTILVTETGYEILTQRSVHDKPQ